MDRISDSGSDDYGSTPYGDTISHPQIGELHQVEDLFFNSTCILRANTLFLSLNIKEFY